MKKLLTVCMLIAFALCTACGMSEGQTLDLYLGSVTVLERRVEDNAESVKTLLLANKEGKPDAAQAQRLTEALNSISQSIKKDKEELEKLTVPEAAKELQDLYVTAFTTTSEGVALAARILDPKSDAKTQQELKSQFLELQKKLEETEAKINAQKLTFAKAYPEIRVPEVFEPQELMEMEKKNKNH